MKRTIFVVISCLLLLGLVLVGCGDGAGYGTGKQVGVWPIGTTMGPAFVGVANFLSRTISGLNWTAIEYTGTELFTIPDAYKTAWGL